MTIVAYESNVFLHGNKSSLIKAICNMLHTSRAMDLFALLLLDHAILSNKETLLLISWCFESLLYESVYILAAAGMMTVLAVDDRNNCTVKLNTSMVSVYNKVSLVKWSLYKLMQWK